MIDICFKKQQIEFLLNNIKNSDLHSKFIQCLHKGSVKKNGYDTNHYIISFSPYERKVILNELLFLISSTGIDSYGEINKQGLIIEDIIDLVHHTKEYL